tara:strand:- start:173 stop:397 length:225 start_codon:yes stop_codon:yes gene_type:complete
MKLKGMAGTLRALKVMEAEIEERFERNDAALYEASGEAQQERLEEKHHWLEDTLMQLQDAIELLKDVRDSKMED